MQEENTNIYWPVYKNLESEVIKIMFYVHIDDNQLLVYSSKISDLILRASTEIESMSKGLYYSNGGNKEGQIMYDRDALKYLNRKWLLSKKIVLISSYNCFQSSREIFPFEKSEVRTGKRTMTYSWNNAYQNLKHDRANSLKFGSIKYLFDVMAALYLLNIYYKKQVFDLEKEHNPSDFPLNLGSDIFSVKLHVQSSMNMYGKYNKNDDFDECTYLTKVTGNTSNKLTELIKSAESEVKNNVFNSISAKISKKLSLTESMSEAELIKMTKSFVNEEANKGSNDILNNAITKNISAFKDMRFEAVLNENQV